ncbi:hypothetical protein MMC16_003795 [Acarospora aff. strigata]|nr:hypothetical protein [Acarospora aff. strigata]
MTDQAELSLFEPQDAQNKRLALHDLSLNLSSPPARSLTPTTHSGLSEQARNVAERRRRRKAHRKIARLREKIGSSRLRLKEKRNELREGRTRASDLDAQFIRVIRQSWQEGQIVDQGSLSGLYQEVQAARDILGPLEDDYNQEEDELDEAEFELNDQEEQVYSLYPGDMSSAGSDGEDERSVPSSFVFLDSTRNDVAESAQPGKSALDEYKSRLGDVNIISERLEDLRLEREQYLEEERLRDRIDLELYPPNRVFLDAYDDHHAELKQKLDHAITDARRLRQKALEEGAVVDELLSPATPIFNRYRALPSRDDEAPALFTEHQSDGVVPNLLNDFASTRARINRWILDTLKNSPVERANHKAILMAINDQCLDDEVWARLVFKYWRRDRAAVSQLDDPPHGDVTCLTDLERKDLNFRTSQVQRYYSEKTPSGDRQLYVDGNPLLTSKAGPFGDVDVTSLPGRQLSESDLYSPFIESRSV